MYFSDLVSAVKYHTVICGAGQRYVENACDGLEPGGEMEIFKVVSNVV